ncbi:MAG: hypothetical protein AABZ53_08960 [Planctomycetota bacterium]
MPTPSNADNTNAADAGGLPKRPLVLGAIVLGAIVAVASLSAGSTDPLTATSFALTKVLTASWPAALYLIAAIGLGRLAGPLFKGAADPLAAQIGCGLAIMLSVSHVLGQVGLLQGTIGLFAGLAPMGAGLVLLAVQLCSNPTGLTALGRSLSHPTEPARSFMPWFVPAAIGVAVMLVAASMPPGYLWSSEYGGFDALSYHLQLPQEWLASGRLAPVSHNMYSFLPSYMEAAFLHLSAMTGAPVAATPDDAMGLLAGDGWRALSCQYLQVGLAILSAIGAARLSHRMLAESGHDGHSATLARSAAGAFVLVVPWVAVCGSLAYNDLGVVALAGPAMLVGADRGLPGWKRGLLCGLLVGVASSVKPPAIFMIGGPVAVLLLTTTPPRQWPAMLSSGVIAGLAACSPWLVRNWQACGNPIFPYASTVFGLAHWSSEQLSRYSAAHHEASSLWHKLELLVSAPIPTPGGKPEQHRGFMHPQWGLVLPFALVAASQCVLDSRTRRWGWRLVAGSALAIVAWLFLTHIQSRFLLPLVLPAAVLVASPLAALGRWNGRAGGMLSILATILTLAIGTAYTVGVYSRESGGAPAQDLSIWPGDLTGLRGRSVLDARFPAQRIEYLMGPNISPEGFCNLALPRESVVYLLGVSTPLYYQCRVVYHTTWDRSPLSEVLGQSSQAATPDQHLAALRARGITHVLVDFAELDRLQRSRYYDPSVTPQSVADLFLGRSSVVRAWGPERSPMQVLFSIAPAKSGLALGEGSTP